MNTTHSAYSKLAISYIRFSSRPQEKGDSIRRQTAATAQLCKDNDLILDESFSMRDLGKSAYHGVHIQTGAFGVFLVSIEAGKIPTGSTLIVEKLDRLSRQHPMRVLPIIDQILRAGIRIATTNPTRFYTTEDMQSNPYILYEIISHLMTGYEESNKKSVRVKAALQEKRSKAISGTVMTSKVPAWLRVTDDRRIEIVEDRADIVRRMFKMADEGMGAPSIARQFNAEGVPYKPGKPWIVSQITTTLKDPKVLGIFQPRSDRKPVGEPLTGYYPAIIDQNLFDRVQVARNGRTKHHQGRQNHDTVNLFSRIMFDASTGDPIGAFSAVVKRGPHKGEKQVCLVSRRKMDTSGSYEMSFRYDVIEEAFVQLFQELDPADFSGMATQDATTLANISASMTLASEKIEITRAKMKGAKDARSYSSYQDQLIELESEHATIKDQYDSIRIRLASPAVELVGDTRALFDLIATSEEPEALRMKIRSRLRQLVDRIHVLFWDEGKSYRMALIEVVFPDGDYRQVITGYSKTKKPYPWIFAKGFGRKTPEISDQEVEIFKTLYGYEPTKSELSRRLPRINCLASLPPKERNAEIARITSGCVEYVVELTEHLQTISM